MENNNIDLLEDFLYCRAKIKSEGFHYCFKLYSSFEEIKDPEFHRLRLEYLESALTLENYINKKIEELEYGE